MWVKPILELVVGTTSQLLKPGLKFDLGSGIKSNNQAFSEGVTRCYFKGLDHNRRMKICQLLQAGLDLFSMI